MAATISTQMYYENNPSNMLGSRSDHGRRRRAHHSLNDGGSTHSTRSAPAKSCLKKEQPYSKSVSFNNYDKGRFVIGLHEYSDQEYAACFVCPEDLERNMRQAKRIAQLERQQESAGSDGKKGRMIRGLEKIVYPEHTQKHRQQAYAAILDHGDVKLYKRIAHQCLREALWLAKKDAEIAEQNSVDDDVVKSKNIGRRTTRKSPVEEGSEVQTRKQQHMIKNKKTMTTMDRPRRCHRMKPVVRCNSLTARAA